jgi:hypothetical protein
MSLKSIISVLLFILFIVALCLQINRQNTAKQKLFKTSLKGRIISTEKGGKGYYNLVFLANNKSGNLSFSYEDSSIIVYSGDSIYKEANSEIFYVKKYDDTAFVKIRLNDYH